MNQTMFDFYLSQSKFSDPKGFEPLLKKLPRDVNKLCDIVQNLLIHEADSAIFNTIFAPSRLEELNLRYAERIIARILELNDEDFTVIRKPNKRVIGTCRDFSLLLAAMCKTLGIPARLRVGFADYLYKADIYGDHVVLEYWHAEEKRWVIIDPRISPYLIDLGKFNLDFSYKDVPLGRFTFAGQAWLDCRAGKADEKKYCYGLDDRYFGLGYIRSKMMQDLAALNKCEMIAWDAWGYMYFDSEYESPTSPAQLKVLDELAELTATQEIDFEQIRSLWTSDAALRVPSIVISYDRYKGPRSIEIPVLD